MKRTSRFAEILTFWQVDTVTEWHTIQDGVFRISLVDGRQFVLKELGLNNEETIRRLHFEYDILRHVAQQGVSVAVPLPSVAGTPYVLYSDHIYRLSHWLPNQPAKIQTSADRTRLYQNYGSAIARFHLALSSYNDSEILRRTWQTDFQTRVLVEAIPNILANLDQVRLPSFKAFLAEIEPKMIAAYANLPTQLIIWDCHPGNVAVNGFEVAGFVDCNHISIAPRIFDLADFLVHLIKWGVGDEQAEAVWLAHFMQLVAGYEFIIPLAKHERAGLFYAMVGILLIFMDFFFQGGQPELTQVELKAFGWLVRYRPEIIAQLEKS